MIGIVQKTLPAAAATALSAALLYNSVAAQEVFALPSGLSVSLQEVRFEERLARFRFVAPELGAEGRSYIDVRGDFPWLCEKMILPALPAGNAVEEVVISLADRPVVFGEMTPGALQFFEAFKLRDGACDREEF